MFTPDEPEYFERQYPVVGDASIASDERMQSFYEPEPEPRPKLERVCIVCRVPLGPAPEHAMMCERCRSMAADQRRLLVHAQCTCPGCGGCNKITADLECSACGWSIGGAA